MKHRVFAFAALLAAGLAGCSSSPASAPTSGSATSPTGFSTGAPDGYGSPAPDPSSSTPTEPLGFSIQTHSRADLQNYSEFTYMTATTTGLAPDAAATADERIKGMVDAVVSDAVAGDDNDCLKGETKCGFFQQTLKPIACTDGYLCLQQDVAASPVGLAISDVQVAVLVLDPETGRAAGLGDVVKAKDRKPFLAAVNDAVTTAQQAKGVYDTNDAPNFTEVDFAAWAPLADGIHVWFPKYTAGPGAMGALEVVVNESDVVGLKSSEAAAAPRNLVSSWDDLYAYYCPRDPADMPQLIDASADPYATSVLQMLLTSWQYDTGSIDGRFGPATQKAVRAYQRDRGLTVDGLVGAQTWEALRTVCEIEGPAAGGSQTVDPPIGTTPGQVVTVPNVLGLGNKDAARSLQSLRLNVSTRRTNGDSSMAAETNNQCTVVDQQPSSGAQVAENSGVAILIDCPSTGFNAPAPPQPYTGADSGQYNGPAPPPAWTGQ